MIIEQTFKIPANRKLTVVVPREIPTDTVVITYAPPAEVKKKDTPLTEALSGILSDLGDVSLEEIRAERLAKYLK